MEPPVTGDFLFTRYGTNLQLIKQDAERYKHFLFTMPYCCASSPTAIRVWYQSVTIHSLTHEIYVHLYYCFRPEANYPKVFSAVNDTNTNKHDLPGKYYTMLSEWGKKIYTALSNKTLPENFDNWKFINRNHFLSG